MQYRFPFSAFPNGWFRVAYSNELPLKKVIPIYYFGKNLILFRTEDGIAHVWDAYCPHLGTHLGYGGKVEGDLIRCPFHGWAFNSQGSCTDIPYASKIPEKAQIPAWPVSEKNGLIWVYHHALREAPSWEIPELPYWNAQEWTDFGQLQWKIRTHPQEMVEQNMDIAHLFLLHKKTFCGIKEVNCEINEHLFGLRTQPQYHLPLLEKLGFETEGYLKTTCYGLGYQINYSRLKTITEWNVIALFFLTPIDEEYLDVRVLVSVKKFLNPLATKALQKKAIASIKTNITEDIPILENKAYPSVPVLCEEESLIQQYRQWVRQFYSEELVVSDLSEAIHKLPETSTR
ncbi:cholesterol 7-desaturase [Nostoc sp. DSM 114161]|jgi:phenylpropionate dioxygenase-like ring-hydroxylating dioxygenase large terminal subunit|uniref:Rieske 2Fe-2S domain-containing protein n=1 Tax=Nostoc sp. DSM 114161 TaxID=3440143 RepID=UPI0040453106